MGIEQRKDTFANRLNQAMAIRRLKQADLVEQTYLSKQQISQYVNGKFEAKQRAIFALAQVLNVNEAWLMGYDVPMTKSHTTTSFFVREECATYGTPKAVRIPVLGKVIAGIPIDAIEDILDWEEITSEMANGYDFFALQIKGDSMEPKISEGDIVIVREQSDVDNGDIAIVGINGDEATIKKVVKYENGSVALVATNPRYAPMVYSIDEIESLPVVILGKVVELRAKL